MSIVVVNAFAFLITFQRDILHHLRTNARLRLQAIYDGQRDNYQIYTT